MALEARDNVAVPKADVAAQDPGAPMKNASDFPEGLVIEHANSKTIFESDNNLFCLLTMNNHPVHTNVVHAEASPFGKVLVVGTLVFSLSVGFTVPEFSYHCIANLGYDKVVHHEPVFVGDTLRARTIVTGNRVSNSNPENAVVSVKTEVLNQDDIVVLSFERSALFKAG